MLNSEEIHQELILLGIDIEPGKNQPTYAYEHHLGNAHYLYVKRKSDALVYKSPLVLDPSSLNKRAVIDEIEGLDVNWGVPTKSTSYRRFPRLNEASQYGYDASVSSIAALSELLMVLTRTAVERNLKKDHKIMKNTINRPLNQILFGPPGTGKTYSTTLRALSLADPAWLTNLQAQGLNDDEFRQQIKAHYEKLRSEQRIAFTTFHQSFSYEDFVEGIRASVDENTGNINYEVHPGIFRQLAELASRSVATHRLSTLSSVPRIWKISIGDVKESEMRNFYIEKGEARIGWNATGDLSLDIEERTTEHKEYWDNLSSKNRSSINNFAEEVQVGDVLLCLKNKNTVQAIGIVESDYYFVGARDNKLDKYAHARKVNWVFKDISFNLLSLNNNKAMVQQTCYALNRISWDDLVAELNIQGYSFSNDRDNAVNPERTNYVLIIDEINRGNISRIFGELITLLEPDKRKGGSDAREVILPYSKEPFSVPSNLYVLGTMNTADKSLAQLDLALRRRFEFIELLPNPGLLEGLNVHGIAISEMLDVLNQRIEVLLDRDHTIGHAYFWSLIGLNSEVEKVDVLAQIFEKRIIPLLQEYFFADWERIGWVLNDPDKQLSAKFLHTAQVGRPVSELFSHLVSGEISDRRYSINKNAFGNPAAYQGILPRSVTSES